MTVVPCKRPKVAIDVSVTGPGGLLYHVRCQVTGCEYAYGPALKSDAEQQATWHRHSHRAAVPKAWVERDVEWDVHCEPCGGHRRTFGTRSDAETWLAYHLSTEHGVVP